MLTAAEVIAKTLEYVQWQREDGETDLRSTICFLRQLLIEVKQEQEQMQC